MNRSLFRLRVLLALILAAFGTPAWTAPAPKVNDEAGLFSAGALAGANEAIAEIYRAQKKDLLIETVPRIPQHLATRYTQRGISAFFKDWARKRMEESGVKGIYILICKQPERLQCEIDKATQSRFTHGDRDQLVKRLVPLLSAKKYDAALAEAVSTVQKTLESRPAKPLPAAGKRGKSAPLPVAQPTSEPALPGGEPDSGIPTWAWVVLGLALFLGIWLLVGVVRAATGTASNHRGGDGGFTSGGGFFSSLLAGLFGAAAGAWLYDRFTHGGEETGAGNFGEDVGGGAGFGDGAQAELPDDSVGDLGGGDSY